MNADSQYNPSPNHYPVAMRWLHWTIAVVILTALGYGLTLGYEIVKGDTPLGGVLMSVHVGCALLSVPLWLVRVFVRRRSILPPMSAPPAQRRGALSMHLLFYVLTIAMPISGYAMDIVYGGAPTDFGLSFPDFGLMPEGQKNEPLGEKIWTFHSYAGNRLAVMVAFHLLGALWGTIKDPRAGIRRM